MHASREGEATRRPEVLNIIIRMLEEETLLYLTAAQPDSMHRSKVERNRRRNMMQNMVERLLYLFELNHIFMQFGI